MVAILHDGIVRGVESGQEAFDAKSNIGVAYQTSTEARVWILRRFWYRYSRTATFKPILNSSKHGHHVVVLVLQGTYSRVDLVISLRVQNVMSRS